MASLRKGDFNGCPHEVLDSRDLKYYRNQPGYWWEPHQDSFSYRDHLPFARAGLAELIFFSCLTFLPALLSLWPLFRRGLQGPFSYLLLINALGLLVIGGLIVWFFRNPPRKIPQDPEAVVSPADGKIVTIEEIAHDEFIGGPAIMIGIFLSIFNVHTNRFPRTARVIGLRYQPGKCLNALRPESTRENERLTIRMQETAAPYRPLHMSQITGAIARRIVCWLKPGDTLNAGVCSA